MRKIFSICLLGMIILSLTSCGPDNGKLAAEAARTFMDETLSGKDLEDNARTDLIRKYLTTVDYNIKEVNPGEEGLYEVKIDMNGIVNPVSEDLQPAVAGREEDFLSSLKKSPKTVSLKFSQGEDKVFKPQNPEVLTGLLYEPFDRVTVTDEDGDPLIYTEGYLDSLYAGAFWYDPLLNNPLLSDTIKAPMVLRLAVCFTRPVKLDYKITFYKDGEEISTLEGGGERSSIIFSELLPGDTGKDGFEPGEYNPVIEFDGRIRKETGLLKVQ